MIKLTDEEYARLKEMADYQIPHKPVWDSDEYADGREVWDAHCPKCGAEMDEWYNFCPECGQNIDWSIDWSEDEESDT